MFTVQCSIDVDEIVVRKEVKKILWKSPIFHNRCYCQYFHKKTKISYHQLFVVFVFSWSFWFCHRCRSWCRWWRHHNLSLSHTHIYIICYIFQNLFVVCYIETDVTSHNILYVKFSRNMDFLFVLTLYKMMLFSYTFV